MKSTENLTDPIAIKYAMERKGGYGAITKLADMINGEKSNMSACIRGKRSTKRYLQAIANYIGQPVHGVKPDTTKEHTA